MKLGHPGEIIFTEETLETNSHQCNKPVLGLWPKTDSCAERRWPPLREASHSPKGTRQPAKQLSSPPRQHEWGLLRQRTEMNWEIKSFIKSSLMVMTCHRRCIRYNRGAGRSGAGGGTENGQAVCLGRGAWGLSVPPPLLL